MFEVSQIYIGPLFVDPATEECPKDKIVLEYPVLSVHVKVIVHSKAVT